MVLKRHSPGEKGNQKGGLWRKTTVQNLIQYVPSGTYFLRGRFGGAPYRESLETDDFRAAKVRLEDRKRELGAANQSRGGIKTLHEALRWIRAGIDGDQGLKPASRERYLNVIDGLLPEGSTEILDEKFSAITETLIRDWWNGVAARFSAMRANQALMFVRRAVAIGKKAGLVRGDPVGCIKRMRVPRTRLKVLTPEEFRGLVAAIQSKHGSKHVSSHWIEFAAYSGMRPAEIEALRWADVGADTITVRGGVTGTKNREVRLLPIIPPMAELLGKLNRGAPHERVLPNGRPRKALKTACERLGMPHMRVYDLRHLFASMCIASGVDVPTLAKWLGHRDGGALAMRTYIHTTDDHSKRSAAKVTFK